MRAVIHESKRKLVLQEGITMRSPLKEEQFRSLLSVFPFNLLLSVFPLILTLIYLSITYLLFLNAQLNKLYKGSVMYYEIKRTLKPVPSVWQALLINLSKETLLDSCQCLERGLFTEQSCLPHCNHFYCVIYAIYLF